MRAVLGHRVVAVDGVAREQPASVIDGGMLFSEGREIPTLEPSSDRANSANQGPNSIWGKIWVKIMMKNLSKKFQ